jgi:rhodanese-related sulfurtransferase
MFRVRASQVFTLKADEAVAAKKALDAGASFAEVVEKFSACPSKKTGGDLGWMNEDGVLSLLGDALSENDKGKIFGPIHSPYGYHILMITAVERETVAEVFQANTPMEELNRRCPPAHSLLFKQFHIGLPIAGYRPEETIASVCQAHGKPITDVLYALNTEYAKTQTPVITAEELKAKIDSAPGAGLALLDIREQWERDIAAIAGSVLITRENCESVLNGLRKDAEIVVIDWKGDRSASFQKWLTQRGFANAKGLQGGIDAWSERIETRQSRYSIDEDDGYRYEDITHQDDHTSHDH